MSFNERKTENLVRNLLKEKKAEYEKESKAHVVIEEQKSDNPRINKLLKAASKGGGGTGYPEFIVSFPNKNLLIVIECKADIRKHKSKTLDKFKSFAVDGVLLYASYLSREFDVIALGVSGENMKELQVDTYIHSRGASKARDMEISKIYGFNNYLDILTNDPKKQKDDFKQLMEYSKTLNQKLRDDFEFEEVFRPLVVSGILLALEDIGFCSAYPTKQKPIEIAHLLITTIKEKLERDNIGETKKATMVQIYSFLKTNTKIIHEKDKGGKPNTLLRDLITEIEDNIKPFSQNYKFHDILGFFYNDFLKYANGDGGLGIVLTPKHITELFASLGEVNKDSVIIDNCCGTGGFLISAMRKMEGAANKDEEKIKEIHTKQLIGIENNAKMFTLACSNMMLRGDGQANIYQQDCFQVERESIKKLKPTVGFLNPPYSKDNGHKELAFIENCLGFLEPNGVCVAIVPQSCAMNTKKGNLAVKKRLLERHTLRAVMSMPDTLFEDSNKNAVTCILVFEAHKPHNVAVSTWFGYWKDDGFIKVRPYGRIDYYHKFENKIRKYWLDTYFARREVEGYSVLKNVNYKDEWLVEPYIKTKFNTLNDADFENTLREYSTFLYYNNLAETVSKKTYSKKRLKLDFSKWEDVRLGWGQENPKGLFEVVGSKTTDKKVLDEKHISKEQQYPYVTTQASNNGVRAFYDTHTDAGNVLVVDSAVAGFCSYQPLNFTASDHVEKLVPKFDINVFNALFLTTVINLEQYRYSYGRKFNQERIRNTIVKLPFKQGEIDWKFMEDYIKGLSYSRHLQII